MKSTETGARAFDGAVGAIDVAVGAIANAPGPVPQKEREDVGDVVSMAPGGHRWVMSALFAVLGFVQPSFAQTAIDGDTLSLNGETIRSYGIDAPKRKQTCGNWPAGELAQEALASRDDPQRDGLGVHAAQRRLPQPGDRSQDGRSRGTLARLRGGVGLSSAGEGRQAEVKLIPRH